MEYIALLRIVLLSAVRNINFPSVDGHYGPPVQLPLLAYTNLTNQLPIARDQDTTGLKAKYNVIMIFTGPKMKFPTCPVFQNLVFPMHFQQRIGAKCHMNEGNVQGIQPYPADFLHVGNLICGLKSGATVVVSITAILNNTIILAVFNLRTLIASKHQRTIVLISNCCWQMVTLYS